MKKRSVLSLLLALSILLSLALPAATTAYAEGENESKGSGMKISKDADENTDGTYTITLEAYATGAKVISEVKKDIPTDIVLVLDQSGSMDYCMVCGKQINSNRQTHNTYTETYSVSRYETYYVKNGSSYTGVTYCSGTHGGSACSGGAGWYTSDRRRDHTAETKITPKTSSTSNGTQFYTVAGSESCSSRLNALKTAVTSFTNQVATKAKGADGQFGTDDDINHRIAMVGFASGEYYQYSYYGYDNTEVFVGSNQYTYGTAAQGQYANAFQEMNTAAGVSNINASIGALAAKGGTLTNLGLEMANGIFEKNPVKQGEQRNRVVIVFTDGVPGWNGYESNVADSAITQANTAKETYGATVYTIGIFAGADATSAGSNDSNANQTQKANWFMQQVSSNNGTVQSPSYYLSAGDSASLNSIFQQISSNIESGGSSTELTEETVIKDIISPQFTLPEGATANNITLETYACTGKDGDEYTWSKNDTAMGATAEITSTDDTHETTTQNQVSVTGFNFKENYVGTVTQNGTTTYRGNKLVIKFNVTPRPGFLGGNGVVTNTSAGVYPNGDAKDPVLTFEQPNVDVTIKEPTVTIPDANVFLGAYFEDTVNSEDLKKGTSIKFGDDIVLDMTKPNDNWGLEDWQTEYVDITVKVTDKDGNEVTSFEKLTEDTDYKVSVSIQPKSEGTSTGFVKDMDGTIHVFKPELTYKDSAAYYGESVSADFSANLVDENWKCGDKNYDDDGVQMLGTKPTLNITYTPDESKLDGTKYGKQDVPVKAVVKIGNDDVTGYTTFLHQDCAGEEWKTPANNPAFLVHIKTCQLTIIKNGGNTDEPYVFNVYKDGQKYTEVTVMGNGSETIYELPVGTYTIQEDTGWSWRFTADNGGSAVLNSTAPTGEITCTNTETNQQWLNGFSQVIRNIFGVAKN